MPSKSIRYKLLHSCATKVNVKLLVTLYGFSLLPYRVQSSLGVRAITVNIHIFG